MSMSENQKNAEDYGYNNNHKRFSPDKYFWVCWRCKTKNLKINNSCYNCATIRR